MKCYFIMLFLMKLVCGDPTGFTCIDQNIMIHGIEKMEANLGYLTNQHKRGNCEDVAKEGNQHSGVFEITIGNKTKRVYCELSHSGNWMVIQRRYNGLESFYRSWEFYQKGFGDLNKEFWLGLDELHELTKAGDQELKIELNQNDIDQAYALYNSFIVSSSKTKYKLFIGGYSGTAGDSLAPHNGMSFSTYDKDSDDSLTNCAEKFSGGWWFKDCRYSNLNGQYSYRKKTVERKGIVWYHWKNNYYSMNAVSMKIRPKPNSAIQQK